VVRAKPLRHACGVPPSSLCRFATSPSGRRASFLIRGGFAAVKFYRNTVCYCETKSLCQGLPCQGSCRADARLRGWTKDAFSVSGITQVLLRTTSPTSSLRSMPPPLIRGGFAAVKFYRNTMCYCETKSLCQWLPFSGELSSGCETERLDKGRL